ncbi:hypothetical protein GM418_16405 [Maribellus comscasis]|uniref:Uncharacterized protein n=1 Tax=Maribellus comscasis TaxID=2681766 RepID=A0A6I6JYA2_9BACT|nr:hypothetical protein [Maribellus comscasis]QGY45197.1 hypothetical protein GM418_16405 [Maribellus comscasis]
MKDKIAVILLVFILFYQLSGVYLWLQQKKLVVKTQVKTQVLNKKKEGERKILLKFTLEETKTKLRWEHSGEFEYNEQMYDIIRTKTVGDSVYYWCWWDKEETELNRKLEKLAEFDRAEENGKDKNHQSIVTFIPTPFCQEIQKIEEIFARNLKKINPDYFIFYSSFFLTPLEPPPKFS